MADSKEEKKKQVTGCLFMIGIVVIVAVVWQLSSGSKKSKTVQPSATADIVDLNAVKLKSPETIKSILGEPNRVEDGANSSTYYFQNDRFEVVFANKLPQSMTINDLSNYRYDNLVLSKLGLDIRKPTFYSEDVMRFENTQGIREISIFPSEKQIFYIYVKF